VVPNVIPVAGSVLGVASNMLPARQTPLLAAAGERRRCLLMVKPASSKRLR
jgi:hypothetical protein